MRVKLFDSELKVMEPLWTQGDLPAKQLATLLRESTGWNRNTTYTIIKKCVDKGAIERLEPNYVCHALITRDEAQAQAVEALLDRMFDGSVDKLFASLLDSRRVPPEVLERLKRRVLESE